MVGVLTAAAPAVGSDWTAAIVGLIVAVFGGGGLTAYLRLRAEGPRIVVQAAQGAVIVQSSVIDDLQEQMDRGKAEVAGLRAQLQETASYQRRIRELERREEELTAENARLQRQVADLRQRLAALENGS